MQFIPKSTVETLMKAFWIGLAGGDVVPVDALPVGKPRMAFEVNAVRRRGLHRVLQLSVAWPNASTPAAQRRDVSGAGMRAGGCLGSAEGGPGTTGG